MTSIVDQFNNLPPQQMLVNQACLEDTLAIQTKCTGMLQQITARMKETRDETPDPAVRIAGLLSALAHHKVEAKTLKDRLYFWSRQEKLIDVTHEMLAIVTRMVTNVDKILTECLEELSLISKVSDEFLKLLDVTESLVKAGATAEVFEALQTHPAPTRLQ